MNNFYHKYQMVELKLIYTIMKKQSFLEKARNKHGYRYEYIDLPDIVMQKDLIKVKYNDSIYEQRVLKHLKGSRPEKKTVNKTTEEFIRESVKVWGNKYDYSLVDYKNAKTKVKIIYDSIVYEQLPNSHLIGCPVEGYLDQEVFIQKSIKKWKNKYGYSLVEFVNANTKVKIIFNDKIYEQTPHNHLKYAPEKRLNKKSTEEFIVMSKEIHDNKYTYEKTNYVSDRAKVIITCPLHGEFEQSCNAHLRGQGCPSCKESRGEKIISSFLNKYDINFVRQKTFPDCKDESHLRFDFYLPSARTCIEFDGIQHFQPLKCFGGHVSYFKLKNRDKIKNDYCEDNYINLVRIRYDQIDDIYQILWENLKNWIKVSNKVN